VIGRARTKTCRSSASGIVVMGVSLLGDAGCGMRDAE
jgi:hypothetical protein